MFLSLGRRPRTQLCTLHSGESRRSKISNLLDFKMKIEKKMFKNVAPFFFHFFLSWQPCHHKERICKLEQNNALKVEWKGAGKGRGGAWEHVDIKFPKRTIAATAKKMKTKYSVLFFLPCVSMCCPLGSNPEAKTLNRLQAMDRVQRQGDER